MVERHQRDPSRWPYNIAVGHSLRIHINKKNDSMLRVAILFVVSGYALAFCPNSPRTQSRPSFVAMAAEQKRRRRKVPPGAPRIPDSPAEDIAELTEEDLAEIAAVAKFDFKPDDFIASDDNGGAGLPGSDPLQLPDIKNQIRKKELEEELVRAEEEAEEKRPRIKRSDKEAFAKVGRNLHFSPDYDEGTSGSTNHNFVCASFWNSSRMPILTLPILKKKNTEQSVLCLEKEPSPS